MRGLAPVCRSFFFLLLWFPGFLWRAPCLFALSGFEWFDMYWSCKSLRHSCQSCRCSLTCFCFCLCCRVLLSRPGVQYPCTVPTGIEAPRILYSTVPSRGTLDSTDMWQVPCQCQCQCQIPDQGVGNYFMQWRRNGRYMQMQLDMLIDPLGDSSMDSPHWDR